VGLALERKIILVTRQTRLAGLRTKFATVSQAKFYVEQAALQERARRQQEAPDDTTQLLADAGTAFSLYADEDTQYQDAVAAVTRDISDLAKVQAVDRAFVPNLVFGPRDIVVTIGQDGLVANTAKYALGLPLVAINPDPARIDGVLLPFAVKQARTAIAKTLAGTAHVREVTLAEATANNGQSLLAFNDFFVGAKSHVSARYAIEYAGHQEMHSSSGVLISTGAGSTGWLSSIFNMAMGLGGLAAKPVQVAKPPSAQWEDKRLFFVVREPFVSKTSQAHLVSGVISPGSELTLESQMSEDGVIFSDGVESDFLAFDSGTIIRIRAARRQAKLVTPS
jgi:NAD kinase